VFCAESFCLGRNEEVQSPPQFIGSSEFQREGRESQAFTLGGVAKMEFALTLGCCCGRPKIFK